MAGELIYKPGVSPMDDRAESAADVDVGIKTALAERG